MLPETIRSLFDVAGNYGLELMAVLALIWFGTLAYVILRKVARFVTRFRTTPEPTRTGSYETFTGAVAEQ